VLQLIIIESDAVCQ